MKNKIKDKIKQKSINIPNKDVEKQKKEVEKEDYMKTSQFLDKVPNNNLFKNDGKYSINYLLEFKYEEEDNSMKDLIVATFFQNQIACIFILYSRFFLLNISNLFNGYSFFENNIYIHLFSLVISYLISKKNKYKDQHIRIFIKLLLDINHSVYIIYSKYKNEISLYEELSYNSIADIMLNLPLKIIALSFLHISITFFLVMKNYSYFILIIYIIFQSIGSFIFVYLTKRTIRYLWFLFDSFKRSFTLFYSLMENEPSPVYIISQNMDILYSNNAAKKFDEYIHKSILNSGLKKKISYKMETNFQKLIIPIIYPVFSKLLDETIKNKIKAFYFPFGSINETLNYKNCNNFFLISTEFPKLIWYKVISSKCIWKLSNCIYIKLIPCYAYIRNEMFLKQIKFILNKLEDYIENSNKMCEIILRCERNSLLSPSVSNKSLRRLGIYMKNTKARRESVLSFVNDVGIVFPNMDYSILFFFKNQSEILLDLFMTQIIYFSIFAKRANIDLTNKKIVNLEIFTNYFIFYFDVLLTSKYYTLDFKMKDNCKFIMIQENLLRITVFNVLLFILSNTKTNNDNKKNIVCSIRLSKEKNIQNNIIENKTVNLLKRKKLSIKNDNRTKNFYTIYFDISITGDSNIDYNKINTLLHFDNIANNDFIKIEITKQSYLNIGIITAYYIVTKIFQKEFIMNSNEKGSTILFGLRCEKDLKYSDEYYETNDSFCFYKENFYFYNIYYHEKLVRNIPNLEINLPNFNYNRLLLKLEKNNNNSIVKSNYFESENEKKNKHNEYISNSNSNNNNSNVYNVNINNTVNQNRKIIHKKNKSISEVSSKLKAVEQDIIKNNQFTSFIVDNLKTE